MMTDPIADFLTRLRNAQLAHHKALSCPSSKMKVRIASILKEEGYIGEFSTQQHDGRDVLHVELRYDSDNAPLIEGLQRVSKPGLRHYAPKDGLRRVRGGIGMAIVSTSRGVMTDGQARKQGIGGEVLCHVW